MLGFEPEMWKTYIPQPVMAAIFCFQIKSAHRDLISKDEAAMSELSKEIANPFFIK